MDKIGENPAVYESLRNGIIATQGTRANYIVYMYSVYAIIFGIGVERSSIYFVVALIILISFQAKINRCKYTISRISAFIRVFFEEKQNDIHWEEANIHESTSEFKKKMDSKLSSVLSGTSSLQLGLLSLFSYTTKTAYNWFASKYTWSSHKYEVIIEVALIIFSIAGVVVLYLLNGEFDVDKDDINEMEDVFRSFRDEKYLKQNST